VGDGREAYEKRLITSPTGRSDSGRLGGLGDLSQCLFDILKEPAALLYELVRMTFKLDAHDFSEDQVGIGVQLEELSTGRIHQRVGQELTGTQRCSFNLRKQVLQGMFWQSCTLTLQTVFRGFSKSIFTAQQQQRREDDSMVLE